MALSILDAPPWECSARCVAAGPGSAVFAFGEATRRDVDVVYAPFEEGEVDPEGLLGADGRILPAVVAEARVALMVDASSEASLVGRSLCASCGRLPFDPATGVLDPAIWEQWTGGTPAAAVRAATHLHGIYVLPAPYLEEREGTQAALRELAAELRARGATATVVSADESPQWDEILARLVPRCPRAT